MRTTVLFLALSVATMALAFTPTVGATNQVCTFQYHACPGIVCAVYDRATGEYAVCVQRHVCVTEPCWP